MPLHGDCTADGTVGLKATSNVPEPLTFSQDLENLYAF